MSHTEEKKQRIALPHGGKKGALLFGSIASPFSSFKPREGHIPQTKSIKKRYFLKYILAGEKKNNQNHMNRILQLLFFFFLTAMALISNRCCKSRKSSKCSHCLPSILQGHWQGQCSTTFHLGMYRLYVGVHCVRKYPGNKDASSSQLKLLG